MNSVRTLEYARNIEERIDGRSLLAQGLKFHREQLLALFGVRVLEDLSTVEAEAVRRLVKRRVVRELAWGRVQAAYEQDNLGAFNAAVDRFQDSVDKEERSERLLDERVREFRQKRDAVPTISDYIASRRAESDPPAETTAEDEDAQHGPATGEGGTS